MIVMRARGPRCGPKIVCEVCRSPIADARQGYVLWDGDQKDAAPHFVHAGAYCRQLEEVYPDGLPLSAWLIYLANGARLKWIKSGQLAVALGGVG